MTESSIKRLFILEEEWKNLIVLDSCRYDYFESLCRLPGKLEARLALASFTTDFINLNLKGRDCKDIVYFSATPAANYRDYMEGQDIWKAEGATSNSFGVVLPDFFREQVEAKLSSYPSDKRFIFHFLQPHYPLIYEPQDSPLSPKFKDSVYDASSCLEYGRKYGWDKVRAAYVYNLKGVLQEVAKLIPKLYRGKTVITADHGELLGRDDKYGHGQWKVEIRPEYDEIWVVPWFVLDKEAEVAMSQLRALGYI